MASTTRFPIRFTGLNRAMAAFGMLPRWCYVDVGDDHVNVRMSWYFQATIDRSSVRAATLDRGGVFSWGVHGWRGNWLVNGSSSGIVRVDIEPQGRARVLGLPVRVSTMRISVSDPDGLIAAIG